MFHNLGPLEGGGGGFHNLGPLEVGCSIILVRWRESVP